MCPGKILRGYGYVRLSLCLSIESRIGLKKDQQGEKCYVLKTIIDFEHQYNTICYKYGKILYRQLANKDKYLQQKWAYSVCFSAHLPYKVNLNMLSGVFVPKKFSNRFCLLTIS